jgi:cullin 1
VLNLIEKQRNGEVVEPFHIKYIVDYIILLDTLDEQSSKSKLYLYRFRFEQPFIAATRIYYERMSRQFLAEHSVSEYMKKVEAWLEGERALVKSELHPNTTRPLCETCLIVAVYSSSLRDEFEVLLNNER